jgi:hypothetical protein
MAMSSSEHTLALMANAAKCASRIGLLLCSEMSAIRMIYRFKECLCIKHSYMPKLPDFPTGCMFDFLNQYHALCRACCFGDFKSPASKLPRMESHAYSVTRQQSILLTQQQLLVAWPAYDVLLDQNKWSINNQHPSQLSRSHHPVARIHPGEQQHILTHRLGCQTGMQLTLDTS